MMPVYGGDAPTTLLRPSARPGVDLPPHQDSRSGCQRSLWLPVPERPVCTATDIWRPVEMSCYLMIPKEPE